MFILIIEVSKVFFYVILGIIIPCIQDIVLFK